MASFWKRCGNRVGRTYDALKSDIFAQAKAKILVSYVVIGALIAAVSGYLIYYSTLHVTQDIIAVMTLALQSKTPVSASAVAGSTMQVINAEIWKTNLLVELFMLIVFGIYAYALARVTLRPIQKTMQRQRRFAANVAHELRTPLSAMKTNFEVTLMGDEATIAEEGPVTLKSGIEEIDRLTATVQFLLDFSALESHHAELEFSDIDLGTVIHETLARLESFIGKRKVIMRAECPQPIMIRGNAVTLGELALNLTKNAVAYTPDHGSVTISATLEGGLPTLSVTDTGIGIPDADLPNIFEPFYRGENAYSQRSKKRGSGLGLAIVKEIAILHKARISVESKLGKGTAISVSFPVAPNKRPAINA